MFRRFRDLVKLNLITVFGATVVANILVAGLMGYWLDSITFKNKVLFIIFLFLGVISGLYNGIKQLLKEARSYERLDKKNGEDDNNPNSG